ncbi:hypothetical protein [Shewanella frigidimarina]|uniref:hypothetical protein n=1 Tax=Shewanella frigidimarina TaxID=56812 RepID=UPI003D7B8FC6
MQYSQLPKQYKFINPVGLPEQLRIATKRHYFCKAFCFLGLIPLCASVLMTLTLDGNQQLFYQAVVALLLPTVILLGLCQHYLVFDCATHQRFVQLQLLGYCFKKNNCESLQSTELILLHNINDRSQYCMRLNGTSYMIGTLQEASNLVLFIAQNFNITAKEQVTDFPNIHTLDTHVPVASLAESCSQGIYTMDMADSNSLHEHKANAKQKDTLNSSSMFIQPLWQVHTGLRLFFPLPFILLFCFSMKYIGGL